MSAACSPSNFGDARVRPCGVLDHIDKPALADAARTCVRDAIANQRPFAVVERRSGDDSTVGQAFVGLVENGTYAVYEALYDSNPCGGGCADRGGTELLRCAAPPTPGGCDRPTVVSDCFECKYETATIVDSWHGNGQTRADLHALFGSTPGSFGPWLAGVRLGKPPAESASALAHAAELSKLDIEADRDVRKMLTVVVRMPGRCTAVRAELSAMWGATTDESWLDPATHRRATLDRHECALSLDGYADLATWFDKDGVVPYGLVGGPIAAVRGRADDSGLEWRDVGVGRSGGPTRVSVIEAGGRVDELTASGKTDAATIAAVRARMIAVFGKPTQDDPAYVGWSKASLEIGAGGEFTLGVTATAR